MNFARTLALGAMAGLLTAAIMAASPARAADIEVKIDNFVFNPQQITVKAGDTVTWVNHDDIPHTVTSKTMAFRSKAMDTDDKFSFTFATPGTFPYFCALHPHMTGTIVVEASAGK
jgi:plastocyanin